MQYCAVDEAYHNFNSNIQNKSIVHNENNQHNQHNITNRVINEDSEQNKSPEVFDNFQDINVNQHKLLKGKRRKQKKSTFEKMHCDDGNEFASKGNFGEFDQSTLNPYKNKLPYFDAQGNYDNQKLKQIYGTKISDLNNNSQSNQNQKQNKITKNIFSQSEDDSFDSGKCSSFDISDTEEKTEFNLSDDYDIHSYDNLDHDYCTKNFLQFFVYNDDMISLNTAFDDKIYKHVKKCKICKKRINSILNKVKLEKQITEQTEKPVVENFNYFGYDIKEIILIIVCGIILVFILDLLVKLGRKTK